MNKKTNSPDFISIPGYDRYLASYDGQIYDQKKQKILNQYPMRACGHEYLYVGITTDKGSTSVPVHRLVALAWCSNQIDLETLNAVLLKKKRLVVDHIDDNDKNNNASNLRFVTDSTNHKKPEARKKIQNSLSYRSRPVTLEKTGDTVFLPSIKAACRYLETWPSNVRNAAKNGWRIRGYDVTIADPVKLDWTPFSPVPVKAIQGDVSIVYDSVSAAAESLDLAPANISACLHGRLKTTGGWSFQEVV